MRFDFTIQNDSYCAMENNSSRSQLGQMKESNQTFRPQSRGPLHVVIMITKTQQDGLYVLQGR